MFQSISWQAYFTAVLISLVIYYLFIWFLFFKNKVPVHANRPATFENAAINHLFKESDHRDYQPKSNNLSYVGALSEENEIRSPSAAAFLDETSALANATGKDCDKANLLLSLKQIARKYPLLGNSSDKQNVIAVLKNIFQRACEVTFDEQELTELWNS